MPKTYTTIQGDTFESIAWFQMGKSEYMWELIKANREHMETVVFDAGVMLTIPDIKAEEERRNEKTPPWRR